MTFFYRILALPLIGVSLFFPAAVSARDAECDYVNAYITDVATASIYQGGGVWRGASFNNDGDYWLLIERVPYNDSVKGINKSIIQATLSDGQIVLPFEDAISTVIKDLAWAHDDFRKSDNTLRFTLSYIGAPGADQQKVTAQCEVKVEGDTIGEALCK